jgi:hypothetical protein
VAWSREFDEPIPLPDGRSLRNLRDAGDYILRLPATEKGLFEWDLAAEVLIMAAEGRGSMLQAKFGMRHALNIGKPRLLQRK